MLVYKAIEGQSIDDVLLNTYGSYDYMLKLLSDNGVSIDTIPYSGQVFFYDEQLISDQAIYTTLKNVGTIYATKHLNNGNILAIIKNDQNTPIIPGQGGGGYYQQDPNISKGQMVAEKQYIAAGGESAIILTELIGASIIQISKDAMPLKLSEYSFNSTAGQINLTTPLVNGETLFVIYGKMIDVSSGGSTQVVEWIRMGSFDSYTSATIPAGSWIGNIVITVISGTPTFSIIDSVESILGDTTESTTIVWSQTYENQNQLEFAISGGTVSIAYQIVQVV